MKKKIKIILLKDKTKKEKKGSIINVARGYAFNYLIPNNIGEIATKNKIKHLKMIQNIIKDKRRENETEMQMLKNNIEKVKQISIYKRKGENNYIFGNITEKDVIRWFNKYTNLKIKKIKIQNFKNKIIGIGKIEVEIDKKISINIPIYIAPINI